MDFSFRFVGPFEENPFADQVWITQWRRWLAECARLYPFRRREVNSGEFISGRRRRIIRSVIATDGGAIWRRSRNNAPTIGLAILAGSHRAAESGVFRNVVENFFQVWKEKTAGQAAIECSTDLIISIGW